MVMQEIVVLLIACLIAAAIVIVPKLVFKKGLSGWLWVFPISLIIGYALMYFTTNEDTILQMLKENLIWAFVISMIVVNVKFLISGTRNRMENGRVFFGDIKKELKKMKPKRTKKKNNEKSNNT